jgi:hypothetical protein
MAIWSELIARMYITLFIILGALFIILGALNSIIIIVDVPALVRLKVFVG